MRKTVKHKKNILLVSGMSQFIVGASKNVNTNTTSSHLLHNKQKFQMFISITKFISKHLNN